MWKPWFKIASSFSNRSIRKRCMLSCNMYSLFWLFSLFPMLILPDFPVIVSFLCCQLTHLFCFLLIILRLYLSPQLIVVLFQVMWFAISPKCFEFWIKTVQSCPSSPAKFSHFHPISHSELLNIVSSLRSTTCSCWPCLEWLMTC